MKIKIHASIKGACESENTKQKTNYFNQKIPKNFRHFL